jgi:hypothetical protein
MKRRQKKKAIEKWMNSMRGMRHARIASQEWQYILHEYPKDVGRAMRRVVSNLTFAITDLVTALDEMAGRR